MYRVGLSCGIVKDQNWQCIVASDTRVVQTNVTTCILSLIGMAKENMDMQCDSATLSLPIGLTLTKSFTEG